MGSRAQLDSIAAGVCTFLTSYLQLTTDQKLLLRITERDGGRGRIPSQFFDVARDLGISVTVDILADNAPFSDAFSTYNAVLYVGLNKSTHGSELKEALKQGLKTRCYRLFDLSPEVFSLCFNVEQDHLASLNRSIIKAARSSKLIKITSRSGTDLTVLPDPRADWTSSYGWFDGHYPGVFPPGEVNSYSEDINGTLVVDGAINTNFAFDCDARLWGRAVRLNIERGRVISAHSSDPVICKMCEIMFSMENGNKIGEIGFGTNEGINELVAFRSHINERLSGFHVGVGSPIQKNRYIQWTTPLHIDFILSDASILFDDKIVFCNQRWIRSSLPSDSLDIVPDLYADTV